ncbi:hypothetical protein SAMN03159341_105383 [Paenibacillus sp. 1_12]|nr:hypothetical protein SAMN03159341_105383 [Paenibacillus sp. 1_12]
MLAEPGSIYFRERNSIQADTARSGLTQFKQQLCERGFTRSAMSYNGHDGTGWRAKTNILQRWKAVVAEQIKFFN